MQNISLKGLSLMFLAVVATTACSIEAPDAFTTEDKEQESVVLAESSRNRSTSDFGGMANLEPIDRSGIRARIEFEDDGTTLTVTGTATGLDPAESYVTLIYDNGSHRIDSGMPFSRVVEVDPTTNAVVWEYRDSPAYNFFSPYISGCQPRRLLR